jgi:hypothetical protein
VLGAFADAEPGGADEGADLGDQEQAPREGDEADGRDVEQAMPRCRR